MSIAKARCTKIFELSFFFCVCCVPCAFLSTTTCEVYPHPANDAWFIFLFIMTHLLHDFHVQSSRSKNFSPSHSWCFFTSDHFSKMFAPATFRRSLQVYCLPRRLLTTWQTRILVCLLELSQYPSTKGYQTVFLTNPGKKIFATIPRYPVLEYRLVNQTT